MDEDSILDADGVTKRFGGLSAVDDVSFSVEEGQTKSLIGPNGAGKTTLINCLSGIHDVSEGSIRFKREEITDCSPDERARQGIGRTFQITNLYDEFTVAENIRFAGQIADRNNFNLWNHYLKDTDQFDKTDRLLREVGLDGVYDQTVNELSHGQKRQLEVAVAMATDPDLLLLDEPTAGMATENISTLVDVLKQLQEKYTIVLIEHNMDVVMEISDSIMVMNQGSLIADAPPAEIREDPAVRSAYLGTETDDALEEA